jgi:ABC-type maltose transport system permease subunit
MNALGRQEHQPTFANLLAIYAVVEKMGRQIKRDYSKDLFDTRPFADLAYAANEAAQLYIPSLAG